jgi:hypothetical protein
VQYAEAAPSAKPSRLDNLHPREPARGKVSADAIARAAADEPKAPRGLSEGRGTGSGSGGATPSATTTGKPRRCHSLMPSSSTTAWA